jgi:hypothetical protein
MDKWFRDIAAKFALPASGEAFGNSDTVGECVPGTRKSAMLF